MKHSIVKVNGRHLHLILGKSVEEWLVKYGYDENLWDFPFEELLDGSIEINEYIWYWYINGRCYETNEDIKLRKR